MDPYRRKEYWLPTTGYDCLHCGGPIKYSPVTLGMNRGIDDSIDTYGLFCCWPCARACANEKDILSDEAENLTTRIMLDFKIDLGSYDDPEGYKFLQRYERFSQVPCAPQRYKFVKYGGHIKYDEHRASWSLSDAPRREEKMGDYLRACSATSSSTSSSTNDPSPTPMWDSIGSSSPLLPMKPITSISTKRKFGMRPKPTTYKIEWPYNNDWSGERPMGT